MIKKNVFTDPQLLYGSKPVIKAISCSVADEHICSCILLNSQASIAHCCAPSGEKGVT